MEILYICKKADTCDDFSCSHRSSHEHKTSCDRYTASCPKCEQINEDFLKKEDMEI